MLKTTVVTSLLAPLMLLGAGACGDDEQQAGADAHEHHDGHVHADAAVSDPDAEVAAYKVTIAFEHLVDGSPVTIGTETPYTNAAGNAFGVSLVRYFISNVTLHLTGGATLEATGAHFVDHEMPATRTYELDLDIPVGTLESISFVMGIPEAQNTTGAFPNEPESLMEWPTMLGGGYHYMKFEGRYINNASEPFNFRAHSGPTRGNDYSFAVALPAGNRSVGEADMTLTLQMNLEEWFTDPNTWDLNNYFTQAMPGIMGNEAAQASLMENGATVFSLGAP